VDDSLKGRVALVTAAAGQGIGQAIARRFAAAGAAVVVTDVHERRTHEVAQKVERDYPGVTVLGLPMDAGDRTAIDATVAEAERRLGPVTVLVNNAALNILGSIFDYDPADWDAVLRVNLNGPWYLCRRTLPGMRDAGGGVVLNVGSYAPDVGGEGNETAYAASKGGLAALTRCIAWEGGPHGIRCNTISMGVVEGTRFIDAHPEIRADGLARSPLGRLAQVDEIAELAAYLASDRARSITGEVVNVAAGSYMRN
jgi:NAD(P)-dependent dehydrogenase (short-subunit alcohol dehydrogenase family)